MTRGLLRLPMIKVQSLRKSYGTIVAVDGVSLDVAHGETFGLLGPNGVGKTTTIGIMTGLLRPEAGDAVINGATGPTRLEVRRQIGLAPQCLALYDLLTGEENLVFFGKLYGLSGTTLKERIG